MGIIRFRLHRINIAQRTSAFDSLPVFFRRRLIQTLFDDYPAPGKEYIELFAAHLKQLTNPRSRLLLGHPGSQLSLKSNLEKRHLVSPW
ncbi:MAG: hypothetical protein ACJAXR_001674 [Halopseudomonas sp.]